MSHLMKNLQQNITSKDAKIGIIGLGYVGLPLVASFLKQGFNVIGIDIDKHKIDQLLKGNSYISHIGPSFLAEHVGKSLKVSTDISIIQEVDVIILCLPTPLKTNKEPDMSYVFNTIDRAIPFLREGQALSLESTTYPGTTSEDIYKKLKINGFIPGENFSLIYSPEREDPGNENFNTQTIPKIVSGHTKSCLVIGKAIYSQIVDKVISVSSTQTAELTKLLENIHRAVNIGLVNEMKIVAEELGIDIYEVIDAASTKPFGFTPYYPGPGIGGHCIPIDPFYLTWKAKQYGVHTKFIELAGEINSHMPYRVVERALIILKNKSIDLKKAKILILGIAYKKDVDDIRESPSLIIMDLLEEKGPTVDYSDPFIASFPNTRKYNFERDSIEINKQNLQKYDLVILCTDHTSFDYNLILKESIDLLDTRGIYRDINLTNLHKA